MSDPYVPTAEHPAPPTGFAGFGGYNYSGVGSPEGVQNGTYGETYWDRTNKILYIKDTVSGNTGWREVIA